MRPQAAWKVRIQIARATGPSMFVRRSRISRPPCSQSDGEDLVRFHPDRGDQVGDAVGEHARLARAGAGDHEQRGLRCTGRPPPGWGSGSRSTLRRCDGHPVDASASPAHPPPRDSRGCLDDYAAAFRVVSEVILEFVQTEDGFRHRQEVLPPRARRRAWVADEDGEVVGLGRRFRPVRGVAARVKSAYRSCPRRGRGIGSALLDHALEHLAHTPRVFSVARADGRSFAEQRGSG